MNKVITAVMLSTAMTSVALSGYAEDLQDMSDPTAVYTQLGAGITNEGLNIKFGNTYDTGNDDTMAMNLVEIKGFAADSLGLDGNDSVNAARFRNFTLDITNGRGAQIDANWNFNNNTGNISYSFIQALPALGSVQFYPLAGVGLTITDSAEIRGQESEIGSVGYALPSSFAVIGTYSKVMLSDKLWLNYNPMYFSTLNDNEFMSDHMDGLHHEIAASYQLNPRQNIRLFGNYAATEANDDWDWRIEFNHQI